METKTEILEDVKLALPPTATVAEAQKQVEKRVGWEPTAKLERCRMLPWSCCRRQIAWGSHERSMLLQHTAARMQRAPPHNPCMHACRLEGFTDPWDSAVFHGRALQLDKSLAEQGITSGAEVVTVRRKLVPEGTGPAAHACMHRP
jgi:hypothetical protein